MNISPKQNLRWSLPLIKAIVIAVTMAVSPRAESALVHRYSFTTDGSDSIGTDHGALLGGASVSGGAVVLNGSSGYVNLPNGILSSLTNVSVEVWLTDNSSAAGARIFDFGNSDGGEDLPATGTQYFFLTPRSNPGSLRGGITPFGASGEQAVEWPGTPLPTGVLKHVVWTADAATQTGRLYVDGVLVGGNSGLTVRPADLGVTLNNWLGRSQYVADPYFQGSITEFRIYDSALTAAEAQANFAAGPDTLVFTGPVVITSQPQSLSVTELLSATLSVAYHGAPPVSAQWLRNGVPVVGATNATLVIPAVPLADNGAAYRVVLTNSYTNATFTATSSNAFLTVTADTNGPSLAGALGIFPNKVLVTFSEGVTSATGTNLANYTITRAGGSLAVTGARLGDTAAQIILTTAMQEPGTNYTLTVNGVRDLAVAANLIPTNRQAGFVAATLTNINIGSPVPAGIMYPVAGGMDLTVGGSGIGGTNDQFAFACQAYAGDFDVQVRVNSLAFVSTWTRAGLMARDGLGANARFVASFATRGAAGCHFESRTTIGGSTTMAGMWPVNYPDTWLRLRRVGNVFYGYASLDGKTWAPLGSSVISLPSTVQVGMAVTAGSPTGVATAQFLNFSDATGVVNTSLAPPFEPLGPCSRRTALVISEIMYNPPDAWGGTNNLEFVELLNSGLVTEDLTGHRLAGEIDYTFPANTRIAPGQFLVIAKSPAAAQNFYGVNCLGPYTGKLANGGGTLRLDNELGARLLEIEYNNQAPWPVAPDGTGHSLTLSRPSYGENDPRAWSASDAMGGSPGAFEPYGADSARAVVINEFLAHTDLPQVDYVELFNTSTQPVDLSGAWLSDRAGTNIYRIADGTTIGARSHLAFTANDLGFALAADGEKIFLVNSNQTRVLDALAFDSQENGVTTGRYPDGSPGFRRLSTATFGTANTPPRARAVVINEIMYHPVSEDDNDEYVEVYNRSGAAVNLGNWRLQGGIGFTFPSNTVIAAGGYLVVGENVTNLLSKYPQLNAANTLGNYSGALANSGDRITLAMPDDLISTNSVGALVTNIIHIPVDEVTYSEGGRWGSWSDGGGSSLELIDPDADNQLSANWADSDETAKAAWTTINVTNILENGHTGAQGAANRFEFFLQGEGEAMVDNLEFHNNGGLNLITNGDFASGTNGWSLGGVARGSYAQNGAGIGNSQALHLVATAPGDTGPNKAATALTTAAIIGSPNTGNIRASVRWLRGSPYILLRVRGHWMEVAQRLNVPSNCGTPGQTNSRAVPNAGPAISAVSHSPVLPSANQAVVVTARVNDPDGIATVSLNYREDPTTTYTTLTMLDNGTGGDAVPGDGLYSATLPGRAGGLLVAFYVSATDTAAAATKFPPGWPVRECLVRWGETIYAGSIGTYRLWVTTNNVIFWGAREKNANDPIDATFVYGNSRAIYNVNTLYSGSPFGTPSFNGPMGSVLCDYEVNFRPDERFLGSEPFVLKRFDINDIAGEHVVRQLGQQFNHRRQIYTVVNGLRRGTIYDDSQQPNAEMVAEYHPKDEHGELRKVEDWFEFADDAITKNNINATIQRFNKTDGTIDLKRYRWNWRPRATSNPDAWDSFVSLITVVNDMTSPDYVNRVRNWIDLPRFLRPMVASHACGNWDSYGYNRGKNMYAYKPDDGPWQLKVWDLEYAFPNNKPVTESIYSINDPILRLMLTNTPAFHREYLRGFQEVLATAFQPGVAEVLLDERYANLQQNNVSVAAFTSIPTYITGRRAYLLTELPAAEFALNSATNQVVSGSNTLTLTGVGPLSVEHILINGSAYAVTWTSISNWSVAVPLRGGTNLLTVTATDRLDNVISNALASVTANYTGSTVAPEGFVVFNEIQFQTGGTRGNFVELFNTHSNYRFDLSGWRVNGLGYTFPVGTTLAPRRYLVLAEDSFAYNQIYGPTNVAFGVFEGSLDPDGETLTLFRPGALPGEEIAVDRVRYEVAAPWPLATNGMSLQLRDATQDNSRVVNWKLAYPSLTTNISTVLTNVVTTTTNISTVLTNIVTQPTNFTFMEFTDVWKYQQTTNLDGQAWVATNFNDADWPAGPGLLACENNPAINSLILTPLNDPRIGTAFVKPGHGYYFRTTLNLAGSLTNYQITAAAYVDDGAVFYVNGREAGARLRMAAGTVTNTTLATGTPPSNDATNAATFTIPATNFLAGLNVLAVEVHQNQTNSADIVFGLKLDAAITNAITNTVSISVTNLVTTTNTITVTNFVVSTNLLSPATPGWANSPATNLPAFPPVWLNELQAANLTGSTDNFGERDPWVEVFNGGINAFSLAGYYLTDTYTNLTKWPIPATASVPPGGFLVVWCDAQTNQSILAAPHAGFRLTNSSGQLVLTRLTNGAPQVVDYLNYTNLPANWSYGDYPDGQPFYRQPMFTATSGRANTNSVAPLTVFINEWLADNAATLADPADSQFEDWFEIHNPGTNTVDLGGYYLTDNLTNKFQFLVPTNGQYTIPPGGYLLVWADNESGQNATNRADLHVNFALAKGGEALGIFASDGTTIDAVTFGAQTTDISQGRFPDGAPNLFSMSTRTPRTSNVNPGTAPALAAIGDRNLIAGQTLTLTNTAIDTDLPAQTLTFSLLNPPAGASVNGTNGVFTWRPSIAQSPSTTPISVKVVDSGVPSMAATQSFSVTVLRPVKPTLGAPSLSNGGINFIIAGDTGPDYVILASTNLTSWAPVWTNSSPNPPFQFTDPTVTNWNQRFFRVLLGP